jgi:hypothetical protein
MGARRGYRVVRWGAVDQQHERERKRRGEARGTKYCRRREDEAKNH